MDDFKNFKGIGISKWTQLRATHELVRRSQLEQLHMQDVFSSIDMVKSFLINTIGHKDHEVFMCLYLDIHNRLLHSEEIFRGSINQTAIYIREVAKACLLRNCSNLIVAHNHPSGHLTPSKEDLAVTKTLAKSLALIEVHLLDHCIVSKNGAISMLELAILPNQASEH
ncbi:DNA repair protein RadC [Polynucleobacter sp. MWH-Spelu-300-X4]|nr:DNA repair protein RadC [Polynucleobacter sp. MWH-Spelu-300-X4]